MSIMRTAPSAPTSAELQAEASAVERLRRQIAEMPSKGESVSPQMLADFARAQKTYLDRKIEFEKLKRSESGILKVPSVDQEVSSSPDPGIPVPGKFAAPLPKVTPPAPGESSVTSVRSKVPVPPLPPGAKPSRSSAIWIVGVTLAVLLGIAALIVLR